MRWLLALLVFAATAALGRGPRQCAALERGTVKDEPGRVGSCGHEFEAGALAEARLGAAGLEGAL